MTITMEQLKKLEESKYFYVVEVEDLSPDALRSRKNNKSYNITIKCPKGNSKVGDEYPEIEEGWCGTTNNVCVYALGKFETYEEAKNSFFNEETMYEYEYKNDFESEFDFEEGIISSFIMKNFKSGDLAIINFDAEDGDIVEYEDPEAICIFSKNSSETMIENITDNEDFNDEENIDEYVNYLEKNGYITETFEYSDYGTHGSEEIILIYAKKKLTKINNNGKTEEWLETDFNLEYGKYYQDDMITSYRIFNVESNIMVLYTNNFSSNPRWCNPDFVRIYDFSNDENYNEYYLIVKKEDLVKLFEEYENEDNFENAIENMTDYILEDYEFAIYDYEKLKELFYKYLWE